MFYRKYSDEFKNSIVKKMCTPDGKTIDALSKEIGICYQTLYKWKNKIHNNISKDNEERSPGKWNISDKYQIILDTANKSGEEFGKLLREKGLQTTHIELWKKECKSMLNNNEIKEENKKLRLQNIELQKDIDRKDKTIAEITALIVLKKKAKEILGIEVC